MPTRATRTELMRSICGALVTKHVPPTTAVKAAHASGTGTPVASPITDPALAVSAHAVTPGSWILFRCRLADHRLVHGPRQQGEANRTPYARLTVDGQSQHSSM